MTTIIDWAIESLTYATIGSFIIGFVRYGWQRAANKPAAVKFWGTIDREFWQTNFAPRQAQPEAIVYAPKSAARSAVLIVPTAPDLSDEALIRWAKSIQFPGSSKWSFGRKLSARVRSELLSLKEG